MVFLFVVVTIITSSLVKVFVDRLTDTEEKNDSHITPNVYMDSSGNLRAGNGAKVLPSYRNGNFVLMSTEGKVVENITQNKHERQKELNKQRAIERNELFYQDPTSLAMRGGAIWRDVVKDEPYIRTDYMYARLDKCVGTQPQAYHAVLRSDCNKYEIDYNSGYLLHHESGWKEYNK